MGFMLAFLIYICARTHTSIHASPDPRTTECAEHIWKRGKKRIKNLQSTNRHAIQFQQNFSSASIESFDCMRFDCFALRMHTHAIRSRSRARHTSPSTYTRDSYRQARAADGDCVCVSECWFDYYETPCSCFTSTRIQFNDRGRLETTSRFLRVNILCERLA